MNLHPNSLGPEDLENVGNLQSLGVPSSSISTSSNVISAKHTNSHGLTVNMKGSKRANALLGNLQSSYAHKLKQGKPSVQSSIHRSLSLPPNESQSFMTNKDTQDKNNSVSEPEMKGNRLVGEKVIHHT